MSEVMERRPTANTASPLRFQEPTRSALLALAPRFPEWDITLNKCDDGDEYLSLTYRPWVNDPCLSIYHIDSGTVRIREGAWNDEKTQEHTADNPSALVEILLTLMAHHDPALAAQRAAEGVTNLAISMGLLDASAAARLMAQWRAQAA